MKNICFITYQFKTGGVERVFCAIANSLKDYNIKLLTATDEKDRFIKNIPSNVEVIDYSNNKLFKSLRQIGYKVNFLQPFINTILLISKICIIRFSNKFNDTCFVNFSDTISSLLLSYYGSHDNYVVSWLHYNPKTFLNSKFTWLYKSTYKKFKEIICISEEQKSIMSKLIPGIQPDRLKVIYNILDYDEMRLLKSEELNLNYKYLVMVARFDLRSKDFISLINAYNDINEKLKAEYKLVFVGDGPDIMQIKNYVNEIHLESNISFVGMQSNPYKWIKNATILVHSSKSEGLPTVLLEAFACGTPVISTNCETGPSEILDYGNAGILVEVGDEKALSEAIETLLANEKLRIKYVDAGTKQLDKFSPSVITRQLKDLWN